MKIGILRASLFKRVYPDSTISQLLEISSVLNKKLSSHDNQERNSLCFCNTNDSLVSRLIVQYLIRFNYRMATEISSN